MAEVIYAWHMFYWIARWQGWTLPAERSERVAWQIKRESTSVNMRGGVQICATSDDECCSTGGRSAGAEVRAKQKSNFKKIFCLLFIIKPVI